MQASSYIISIVFLLIVWRIYLVCWCFIMKFYVCVCVFDWFPHVIRIACFSLLSLQQDRWPFNWATLRWSTEGSFQGNNFHHSCRNYLFDVSINILTHLVVFCRRILTSFRDRRVTYLILKTHEWRHKFILLSRGPAVVSEFNLSRNSARNVRNSTSFNVWLRHLYI